MINQLQDKPTGRRISGKPQSDLIFTKPEPQSSTSANTPQDHRRRWRRGNEMPVHACSHSSIDDLQAKHTRGANSSTSSQNIFACQRNIMLDNHKCQHLTGPRGGRWGKQKEDAVKLVVCIGGGDHLQAINKQAKTSLWSPKQNARTTRASTPLKLGAGDRQSPHQYHPAESKSESQGQGHERGGDIPLANKEQ